MGLKHSGKTTFAKLYACHASLAFEDADYLIQKRIKPLTVREYYKAKGKESFMELELDAVDDFLLSYDRPFVLSLGGGASDNTPLMERVRRSGKLIYLYRKEEDLLPVILKDGIPPFLDGSDVEGSFHKLYGRRDAIYRRYADRIIDLGPYIDLEENFRLLLRHLKEDKS